MLRGQAWVHWLTFDSKTVAVNVCCMNPRTGYSSLLQMSLVFYASRTIMVIFFPSPPPQWQMPAQSKFGIFPCEKQEQSCASLISCAMLSTVTARKKLAGQTTLFTKEWYQVHHGNIRNICNKSHTMEEKKNNGVSIQNTLYNTTGLFSLHFRMTSVIFLCLITAPL